MKFKPVLIAIILLLGVTFSKVNAQTTEPNITPSHLQAAGDLLVAVGISTQFNAMVDNIIGSFSKQLPEDQRAGFEGVMKKFMGKYYTWEIIKTPMAKTYATEFDENELKQLAVFYNSPVGKKYTSKLPELMQKGMMIGQQIMAEHKAELVDMIKEASSHH